MSNTKQDTEIEFDLTCPEFIREMLPFEEKKPIAKALMATYKRLLKKGIKLTKNTPVGAWKTKNNEYRIEPDLSPLTCLLIVFMAKDIKKDEGLNFVNAGKVDEVLKPARYRKKK